MAKMNINLSINWENQAELKELLDSIETARVEYERALTALTEYQPEMVVVQGGQK